MTNKEKLEVVTSPAKLVIASTDAKKRTITGDIMVFEERGNTSAGPMTFAAGSLILPDQLNHVKLLKDHDMAQPIGFLSAFSQNDSSLTATFEVPPSEAGDEALEAVKAGLYDGLSVGATIERLDPNSGAIPHVIQASLYEVSLVSTPAFPNARVTNVTAKKEVSTMPTTENTNLAPENEAKDLEPVPTGDQPTLEVTPAPASMTASINGAPAPTPARPVLSVTAAADRIIQGVRAGESDSSITAALTDVVPANDKGEGFLRKTFIGQLWTASDASRPTIEAFGPAKKLTGLKAYGWRWKVGKTPTISPYTSDKKAIASNALETEPAEGVTQDFAAGWDVARKYIDLGDTGFIESIFQMATDDYKRKTEAWFAAEVLKAATARSDMTTVLMALQKLPIEFGKLGARISSIQMGEKAYEGFLNLKDNQVPWWLQRQGEVDLANARGVASNVSYVMNPALGQNDILAFDSRAASYYEEGPSPIRAQVLDLPRGGVDVGVFGYAGALVHDPRAIMKATVTGAA